MTVRVVHVSGCACIVNKGGADAEVLYALWRATRKLSPPYTIRQLPRTGDGYSFTIEY